MAGNPFGGLPGATPALATGAPSPATTSGSGGYNPYAPQTGSGTYTTPGATTLANSYGLNPGGTNPFETMLKNFGYNAYGGAASNLNFQQGLIPQNQASIQSEVNSLNPAGLASQRNALQAGARETANTAGVNANLSDQAMGLGTGFRVGNIAGAQQQGANASNQIAQTYASPAFQAQAAQQQQGAIAQANNNPELQMLEGFFGPTMQNNQFNAQTRQPNMFASILGSILGQGSGSGGFLSNLFGGGGGGGAAGYGGGTGGGGVGPFENLLGGGGGSTLGDEIDPLAYADV